jgi:hypothetical protein
VRGSAAPDLPGDAIVLGLVVLAITAGALLGTTAERRHGKLERHMNREDDPRGNGRQDEEI